LMSSGPARKRRFWAEIKGRLSSMRDGHDRAAGSEP